MKAKRRSYLRDGGYRHIRTQQERKAYYGHKEYVRGKRSARMLPNYWDEVYRAELGKSWKNKRKTQYRVGGRGQKQVFLLNTWVCEWYITRYLDIQDIPYELERVRVGSWHWCSWRHEMYHRSEVTHYELTVWYDGDLQFPGEAWQWQHRFS